MLDFALEPFVFDFRKVYVEREEAYETSVKLYSDVSPRDIGIPLKLFPQNTGSPQGSYPYGSAIQELKLLIHDRCPQRKLECIGESDCVVFILVYTKAEFWDGKLVLRED